LPAISTPAADPRAGETLVVAEESRGVTPRREAAHQTGHETPGVAAVQAISGRPGMAFPRYGEQDVRQPSPEHKRKRPGMAFRRYYLSEIVRASGRRI
jgi:hypothetical protein